VLHEWEVFIGMLFLFLFVQLFIVLLSFFSVVLLHEFYFFQFSGLEMLFIKRT